MNIYLVIAIFLDSVLLLIYLTLSLLSYLLKFRKGDEDIVWVARVYFPFEFIFHSIVFISLLIKRYEYKKKTCPTYLRITLLIISTPSICLASLNNKIIFLLLPLSFIIQMMLFRVTSILINEGEPTILSHLINNAFLPNDSSAPIPSNALLTQSTEGDSIDKPTESFN